ncbi:MAG TPA: NAD(P)-dependent oxidoreductase [Syntrophorhabdaceae bacterium]|nr:NAD(P)-dependent oxidoreductase [Syntrophorhabdaceae bacterium]HQM80936.1 NAD(P)-dependent oxidoreductase [Syntrophorhabdaceae bacterium]
MKILITGGAGYVGSVLANAALGSGCSVRVIDALHFDRKVPIIHLSNPNYEFFRIDICERQNIAPLLEGVDYVIHTAAIVGEPASNRFPELTEKTNYAAAKEIIRLCAEKGVKGFIFLSTCSNYGITEGLAREDGVLKPLSLYADTKVRVERLLMDGTPGIDWVVCRMSTVYGASPRMRFDLTVNDFAMNAYRKRYLDVFLPYTYRPYIHVYDAARVIMSMIEHFGEARNNVFNVGFNGENYQKIKIADIVRQFIPDLKIDVVDKGTDLRDYQVDFRKLEQYLGLKNLFTVEDGVKEVVDMLSQGIIEDPDADIYYNTKPRLENPVEH